MKRPPPFAALALVASLGACGILDREAASAPPARLAGTAWLAQDVDGKGVINRAQSTIEFVDEQRIAGSLGSNRYTGAYGADATGLRFSQLASTRRMCPEALMEQESRFNAVLGATRGFRFESTGALVLLDEEGRSRARLMPAPAGR